MILLLALAIQGMLSDTLWTESAEGYSFNVAYPEVALENTALGDRLEEYAQGQVTQLRGCYYKYFQDDPFLPDFDMELIFTHEPSPNGYICILAWLWEYTGGAHGNTMTQAFIYDITEERFINTVELLGGEERFEAFAEGVVEFLQSDEYYDPGWVERGASPDPQNYHSVIPVPGENGEITGYTVLFPPYQVDCYASGTIEVFVPVDGAPSTPR